ncbi:DUF167 domain-containing protein, partial [Thalassobaculum salexigens]|uniref:DUF167 domain-containing protein n=1 Tax=Thalassobaculum salexigens TaxID=455360 RepID=UPI003CD0C80F
MYVKVRVQAGVKKEIFTKVSETHFKIATQEPAEQNRANKHMLALLADHLQLPVEKLR